MRPTVLLFDIDGTLLSSGGAGRRAMERAFLEHTGRNDACEGFNFSGMTDRGIVRRGLTEIGREPDDATMNAVMQGYLEALADEIPKAKDYTVYPGVRQTLDQVAHQQGVALGLGTGNVRQGADLKLGHVALSHYFSFGGFGCDFEDRAELIRTGGERGLKALGVTALESRVVVIGDTPKDVLAAKANGYECLAVGTGRFKVDALREAGATWTFETLADERVVPLLLRAA